MKLIFVAGIHAVGKTSACQMVSRKLGIPHYSASQIIREEKSSAISEGTKLVADIADNQKLLIQGVSRRLEGGRCILDGHFTMRRKSDNGIEAVDTDVFRNLRVGSIVLFTDYPEVISDRMLTRDGVSHSAELLQSHQDVEIAHANHVASVLKVPFVRLHAPDSKSIIEAFSELVTVQK